MRAKKDTLSLRVNDDNPNHHLWNNRGVWWCHITVHKANYQTERLRFSLRTRKVEKARVLRDRIFADLKKYYTIK